MIYDALSNFGLYTAVHPLFNEVQAALADGLLALSVGRHDLAAGIYVSVSEYLTRPAAESFIECHRKYIDIQLLSAGVERIGVAAKALCAEASGYDADRDFQQLTGRLDFLTLAPGHFAVFFPADGHMPGISAEQPERVKKFVVKVPVASA
jgi:biofilm protein TabA